MSMSYFGDFNHIREKHAYVYIQCLHRHMHTAVDSYALGCCWVLATSMMVFRFTIQLYVNLWRCLCMKCIPNALCESMAVIVTVWLCCGSTVCSVVCCDGLLVLLFTFSDPIDWQQNASNGHLSYPSKRFICKIMSRVSDCVQLCSNTHCLPSYTS